MSKSVNHIPALDGLRALAVLMVMLTHFPYGIWHGGFLGVDLFFVLSGYLITALILREYEKTETVSLKKFYARRALRLLPAVFFVIALTALMWPQIKPNWPDSYSSWVLPALIVLFYCANIFVKKIANLCVCWSLSVEEHFYFIWPVFLKTALKKMPLQRLFWYPIIFALLVWMLRIYLYLYWPQVDTFFCTFTRIDTIMIGAAAAIAMKAFPEASRYADMCQKWRLPEAVLLIWLMLCWVANMTDSWLFYGGFDLIAIGIAISIICVARPEAKQTLLVKFLSLGPLVWIGVRSYGIYLYHFPFLSTFEFLRVRHDYVNFAAVTCLRFAVVFLVAAFSYKFIEQPFLRWKEKFTTAVIEPDGNLT